MNKLAHSAKFHIFFWCIWFQRRTYYYELFLNLGVAILTYGKYVTTPSSVYLGFKSAEHLWTSVRNGSSRLLFGMPRYRKLLSFIRPHWGCAEQRGPTACSLCVHSYWKRTDNKLRSSARSNGKQIEHLLINRTERRKKRRRTARGRAAEDKERQRAGGGGGPRRKKKNSGQ